MGVRRGFGQRCEKTCPRARIPCPRRHLWLGSSLPCHSDQAMRHIARHATRSEPPAATGLNCAGDGASRCRLCDHAGLGGRRHRASHRSTLAEPPPHEWRLRQFVVVQNHFPLLPRSVWRAPGVSRPALRARQRRADASPRAQGSPFLCALSLRVAAKSLMTRWRARRPVQERLVPSGARLGRGDRSAHESAGETDRPDKAMARR